MFTTQGLGLGDQLVFHIRYVHDPRDLEALERQISLDDIEDHGPHGMADVGWLVHRRATEIDADFAGPLRLEQLFFT